MAARKLKTFVTSIGFYDLAVAAPSMKAALEAWNSTRNLFHDGTAQEMDDASVVQATLTQPGVVLRRPVGSTGDYKEKPDALMDLPTTTSRQYVPRCAL
jgi:colicin import membrane protein